MTGNMRALLCGTSMAVLALAAPTLVKAQDRPANNEQTYEIDEIIVTATRRETSLLETPVSVTAVTQENLTRSGVNSFTDIAKLVPNLGIAISPNEGGVGISIRGVGSNNFTEIGDPAVAFHVDGVYIPRPQSALALLFDTERVEILRGPQGTLFGRNSAAGAVNVISAAPDFSSTYGGIDAEVGNYNHRQVRAFLNLPISDTFAVRGALMYNARDGWIDQHMDVYDHDGDGIANTDQRWNHEVGPEDYYYNANQWGGRLTARWNPTEALDMRLTYERYQDKGAGVVGLPDCGAIEGTPWDCGDRSSEWAGINQPGSIDMTQDSWRAQINYRLSDSLSLQYRGGYTKQSRYQLADGDAGWYPVFTNDPRVAVWDAALGDFRPRDPVAADGNMLWPWNEIIFETDYSDYKSWVNEIQIQSSGDGPLQWTAGVFNMREKNAIKFDIELPFNGVPPVPLGMTFLQPDRRVETTATYAQVDYALNDQWNLTLGYRYTWDKKSDNGGVNYSAMGPGWWGGYYGNAAGTLDPLGFMPWHPGFNPLRPWAGYQADVLDRTSGSWILSNLVPNSDNTGSEKWSKDTWRIGLDYTIDDNHFIYGSIATGYKAGGFQDKIDVCRCGDVRFFPWDPETVTNYEIGYKGRLASNLTVMASAFYTDYSDMQDTSYTIVGSDASTGDDIGTLTTTNVAQARMLGVEVEFDWRPWDGGRLFGFGTWLDSKVEEYPRVNVNNAWSCWSQAYLGIGDCDAQYEEVEGQLFADAKGNRLPYAPKFAFTLNGEQTFNLDNGFYVRAFASYHYQTKIYFNYFNFDVDPFAQSQDAYGKVDASLRFGPQGDAWYVEAYGYNLTDERTRNYTHGESSFSQVQRYQWDNPRFFGLRAGWKFGG